MANAPQPVHKNNWLHPYSNLFSKHRDKHIGIGFLTGNNIIPPPQIKHKHDLFHFNQYNYSILSDNTTNITPCSIAACESMGNAPSSNKICRVLFDSGSSKTLIHKRIVPCNYTPISSTDDLRIFLLAGATTSKALMALEKIRFPEFNHNIVIDKHPALIVDSTSLCYDIIFGAYFFDKCDITLNYENHQVQWMEYTIPLRNASKFFSSNY